MRLNDGLSNSTSSNTSSNDKTDQDCFEENIDENETNESGGRPRSRSASGGGNKRRYKSGVVQNNDKKESRNKDKHSKDDLSLKSSNEGKLKSLFLIKKQTKDLLLKDTSKRSDDTGNNEICKPGCWCNGLVEVKLIYPTKEVSYLSIVESKTHDIDLSLFIAQEQKAAATRPSQATAIENRKNNKNLERISESSVLQDSTNGKHDDDNEINGGNGKKSQEFKTNNKLVRKASFDSSLEKTPNKNAYNIVKTSSMKDDDSDEVSMSSNINTLDLSVEPTIEHLSFVDNQFKQRVTFTNQNIMSEAISDDQSLTTEKTVERIVNKSGGAAKTLFPNFSTCLY
jgi:hypothetical protein